jgi:hypothetical protein
MEAAVRKHVRIILQYSTSTIFRMSFKHFFDLVKPYLKDPTHPVELSASHPIARLIKTPDNHFPCEDADQFVYIVRDESYRFCEDYLATYLYAIPITGVGRHPHTTSLDQLTEATVDVAIDNGLFTTAIIVLEPLLSVRTRNLIQSMQKRLTERNSDWSEDVITRKLSTFVIHSLDIIRNLPSHITTIILDMAHLFGSNEHFQWVDYFNTIRLGGSSHDERTLNVIAVGWKNVPAMTPGWSFADFITPDAVEDMIGINGPWHRTPEYAPRYRSNAALVKMSNQLALDRRGLVVLARGNTDSMEASKCKTWIRNIQLNSLTTVVGLNNLPLFLMNAKATLPNMRPILVLQEYIAEKMTLDHWMLLLSHAQDAVLVLILNEENQANAASILPVDRIRTWLITGKNKEPRSPFLTATIHKTSPFLSD